MNIHKENIPAIDKLLKGTANNYLYTQTYDQFISIGKDGFFFEHQGFIFPTSHHEKPGMDKYEQLEIIRNLKSSENGVIIAGMPKAGSHLCMSLLDALGNAF